MNTLAEEIVDTLAAVVTSTTVDAVGAREGGFVGDGVGAAIGARTAGNGTGELVVGSVVGC